MAAVGTVAVIVVGLVEAGVGPGEVLGTSLGRRSSGGPCRSSWPGSATLLGPRRPSARARRSPSSPSAAGGAMLADVLRSHAAAGSTPALDVIVQTLHILAVGLWLGGLACLLLVIRRSARRRGHGDHGGRGSRALATIGIAMVAITGLLRAIRRSGTLDALVSTDFGRLVIAKTALLAVLAGLGAVNHFRNVPAAASEPARPATRGVRRGPRRRDGRAARRRPSSTWPRRPSPRRVVRRPSPSPTPAPLVVDGTDFGTSVRLRLEVSPGLAGFNTFTATVTDYDTGAAHRRGRRDPPVRDPGRPDVGGSRLDLPPVGAGVFSATGANLSLDGAWRITAVVARGAASVEVPLD